MDRRLSAISLFLAALVLALPLTVVTTAHHPARAASDVLPDIGMAHPRELSIDRTADGRKLLRFSSIVVNVGPGRLEVLGQRAAGAATMTIQQRIFDDAGGSRHVPTAATAYFGGDGHNHWHVSDLERFELVRLDNGRLVGTGAKHGFCFFDNFRYGSTNPPYYTTQTGACGRSDSTTMTMGLSRGWGDRYGYDLPDQYIDVTGLTAGRYRLVATADESNWFQELDDQNNESWIDIQLKGGSVKIVRYGPSA